MAQSTNSGKTELIIIITNFILNENYFIMSILKSSINELRNEQYKVKIIIIENTIFPLKFENTIRSTTIKAMEAPNYLNNNEYQYALSQCGIEHSKSFILIIILTVIKIVAGYKV